FRTGGMHFRINAPIVGFLINDEPFRASLDNRHVILRFHWAYFDRNRRKIWRERPHEFGEIIAAHKFGMLARDEKDLAKSLASEMLRFDDDFIHVERDAKDGIVARKTAVAAIVNAFIGKIQRSKQPHCPSKILERERP